MNRLNKFVISFVLPFFFLLISVSYADWTSTPIKNTSKIESNYTTTPATFGDYTMATIKALVKNYMNDSTTYETQYNSMIEYLENMNLALVFARRGTDSYCFVFPDNIDVGLYSGTNYYFINNGRVDFGTTAYSTYYYGNSTDTTAVYFNVNQSNSLFYSTKSVKNISYANGYYWDGTYVYEVPTVPDEPDTPSLPSNAEIAQAVQAFYNSDYYKNNTDFDDFLVMYNYNTQYFSFVGHNFGSNLGQVIVPPDYEYEGYSYKQDWWKFFLRNISSELASNLWNRYYWLYSTNDFGENITYDGKGAIKDILDIHWATSSIIVYSTTDYPVVKIETDENGVLTPVEGTVPGNQYTYDENLDPTTNEYNPLENFVPTNPSQTILGDVDFDEINKTFEENKGILNIENARWLFTANNQFVGYFIGFLSLLIVFLIISRILGG